MNVTIKARGYEGIKGEVVREDNRGAWVSITRKGMDLAARVVFFVWSSLKKESVKAPEAPKSTLVAGNKVRTVGGTGVVTRDSYVSAGGEEMVWVKIDGATKNVNRRYKVAKVAKVA